MVPLASEVLSAIFGAKPFAKFANIEFLALTDAGFANALGRTHIGYPLSHLAITGVSLEPDRSLQVQTEVPLSVVESRGPLIDTCHYRCSLEDGDHEVGDRMWFNLRVDFSG